MKSLLRICLISISLYSCKNLSDNRSADEKTDSSNVVVPPDSVLNRDRDGNAAFAPNPGDFEKETQRQIIANLLFSKAEINKLREEVSDSLKKSGLSFERHALFVKTMRELEASSDIANKQLQEIVIGDLQKSRDKLNDLVKRMKGSEKELAAMIQRLDKITGYMQVATTLMQTLLPIPAVNTPAATPSKPAKESK